MALAKGRMLSDAASPDVIAHTKDMWKDHVRLYFRPRTPTQYNSEGIRPAGQYGRGSCCPIPIVMLFSSRDILTLAATRFSAGGLAASNADVGEDASFLRSIPFEKVYHDESFFPEERSAYVFHRHAEVIYPRELDLSALRAIYCRTTAERETLLSLLTPTATKRWSKSIGLSSKHGLHFRQWTFLERVALDSAAVELSFNPSTHSPGPFKVELEIKSGDNKFLWRADQFNARGRTTIKIAGNLRSYEIRIHLDGSLIYRNRYRELADLF